MPALPINSAPKGFTHAAVVRFSDISAAATTKVVDLFSAPADSIVREVGFYLNEAFDGGATSGLTLQIGVTGVDTDGFVTAIEVHADGTEVSSAYCDGAFFTVGGDAGTAKAKVYDAASATTISALFTATGGNTEVLTQGKVTIFANIVDLSSVK